MTQELWTFDELAEYLRVSPRTARRWVREKGIPTLRTGRQYRFEPAAVAAWVQDNLTTAAT